MLSRRNLIALGAGALSARAALPSVVFAQTKYPDRPIRLVISFPPGGSYDAVGRPWADKMKPLLGTVVVENVGGGGGSLAAGQVSRAQPDGYTILLGGSGAVVLYRLTRSRPQYNPEDLEPVSVLAITSYAIAVHPSVPARTLKELVEYGKANPGKLSYGSAGVGSLNHLAGELFKSLVKSPDIVHVPYRGAGPAISDAISGQIPIVIPAVNGQLLEYHRGGQLRVLAVTGQERLAGAPDIPIAAEAGVPGLLVQNYICLFTPTGTPAAIKEQIALATNTGMADEALRQNFIRSGVEPPRDASADAFRRFATDELARWTPIIQGIGLKLD